jgi:hypothetical protein
MPADVLWTTDRPERLSSNPLKNPPLFLSAVHSLNAELKGVIAIFNVLNKTFFLL